MRFRIGMPPDVTCGLDSPRRLVMDYPRLHAIALVFGVLVVLPVVYLAWFACFGSVGLLDMLDQPPEVFLGSLVLVLLAHELLHLFAMPHFGRGGDSMLGFDPKSCLPYAAHTGIMRRRRMLFVLCAPLLVLTVLPFFVAVFQPEWKWLCAWISMLNGTLASGDIYMVIMVLRRVPSGNAFHGEFYGIPRPVLAQVGHQAACKEPAEHG